MSSRERRILHLAMRDIDDLRTESAGEAAQRHVVVYPKDYKGKPPAPPVHREDDRRCSPVALRHGEKLGLRQIRLADGHRRFYSFCHL